MSDITSKYEFKMECRPDYGFLTVNIPEGEKLLVEASSMATMSTTLKMKTKLRGGFRRFLSGESLFINEFTATKGPGEIGIAPGCAGDMDHVFLSNETIYLQNSAFVACTPDVNVDTKWQGVKKGFFSGESFFLIKCSGEGDLWFNTYGSMIQIEVEKDFVVDTGYIVAFTEGLDYDIKPVGGLKSFFLSGEGLVCKFSGQGKVWIQTRQALPFVGWADFFRPIKKEVETSGD